MKPPDPSAVTLSANSPTFQEFAIEKARRCPRPNGNFVDGDELLDQLHAMRGPRRKPGRRLSVEQMPWFTCTVESNRARAKGACSVRDLDNPWNACILDGDGKMLRSQGNLGQYRRCSARRSTTNSTLLLTGVLV
jgi:hypothetical protein